MLSDIYPHNDVELFSRKEVSVVRQNQALVVILIRLFTAIKAENIHRLALKFIWNLPVRERWLIHTSVTQTGHTS